MRSMLLKPFGPKILRSFLPEKYRQALLADAFNMDDDASPILAGQVNEQLYFYPEEGMMTPFNYAVHEYLGEQRIHSIEPLWVNFAVAGDWQPVHNHDGDLSLVAFLDVPKGIYEETEIEGSLFFQYGERIQHNRNVYGPIKPQVGEFYIFPSWLNHYVYPFISSGQRISLSGNIYT